MKCILCETEVPQDQWQCGRCGEHLGQWKELDETADEFFSEGLLSAQASEPLKAAMALLKASALQPRQPEILKTLGMVLAQEGIYDAASFYLKRSVNLAESLGLPCDPSAQAALHKSEEMQKREQKMLRFLRMHHDFDARQSPLVRPLDDSAASQVAPVAGRANMTGDDLWDAVYMFETRWQPVLGAFEPILQYALAGNRDAHPAWDYLHGLLAFRSGEVERAREFFRSSLAKDQQQTGPKAYLLYLAAKENVLASTVRNLEQSSKDRRAFVTLLEDLSLACRKRQEIGLTRMLLEAALEIVEHHKDEGALVRLHAVLERTCRDMGADAEADQHRRAAEALKGTNAERQHAPEPIQNVVIEVPSATAALPSGIPNVDGRPQ